MDGSISLLAIRHGLVSKARSVRWQRNSIARAKPSLLVAWISQLPPPMRIPILVQTCRSFGKQQNGANLTDESRWRYLPAFSLSRKTFHATLGRYSCAQWKLRASLTARISLNRSLAQYESAVYVAIRPQSSAQAWSLAAAITPQYDTSLNRSGEMRIEASPSSPSKLRPHSSIHGFGKSLALGTSLDTQVVSRLISNGFPSLDDYWRALGLQR